MVDMIPSLSSCAGKMTGGERRLAERFIQFLEDDYVCWYDIPLGRQRRYPDFIILHPDRGLLFLEVKDWKMSTIKKISPVEFTLITNSGVKTVVNPIEQVRQCTYAALQKFNADPALLQTEGRYQGKLIFPYGYGIVLSNITRQQLNLAVPMEMQEKILPPHLVICQDEMYDSMDAEAFQEKLWGMFSYNFRRTLTLPEIDRIRWHLFPELRLDVPQQSLFDSKSMDEVMPDIVKIMDIQQEQLARSMGAGHRVVHGVAGSGKTLILGYRCLHLSGLVTKPILVLCYNITLATTLRNYLEAHGVSDKVHIYHFHDWCGQQLKTYHVDTVPGEAPVYDRKVLSVIKGVDEGRIPRAQYGALLIDEGHDFEPEWLKLVTQMIDPEKDHLLLLYDDAQSIYTRNKGLDFTLSSVGIQARGRTTVLKLNYRNTQEILSFAHVFCQDYFLDVTEKKRGLKDALPMLEPEKAGKHGFKPAIKRLESIRAEMDYITNTLLQWQQKGKALADMAIIYPNMQYAKLLADTLTQAGIVHKLLNNAANKRDFDLSCPVLVSRQSSKGLEFKTVILGGLGQLKDAEPTREQELKLLYVSMTRAKEELLICAQGDNYFTQRLADMDEYSVEL